MILTYASKYLEENVIDDYIKILENSENSLWFPNNQLNFATLKNLGEILNDKRFLKKRHPNFVLKLGILIEGRLKKFLTGVCTVISYNSIKKIMILI